MIIFAICIENTGSHYHDNRYTLRACSRPHICTPIYILTTNCRTWSRHAETTAPIAGLWSVMIDWNCVMHIFHSRFSKTRTNQLLLSHRRTMPSRFIALLAGVSSALALAQKPLGQDSGFKCDLPPVLKPAGDGLPSSDEFFSSQDALLAQVERHQAIVRVPSICYDDLGDFDKDERWTPFHEVHRVLEKTYPIM